MIKILESKSNIRSGSEIKAEYYAVVGDLVSHDAVQALDGFVHHRNFSRLEHVLHVSYLSYLVCRKTGLDSQSAARGGLLHDLYFYDSHTVKPDRGIHCFCHPTIAVENASELFTLNEIEKDIILKHMWPVTIRPPKYKESYIVSLLDKYCASREALPNESVSAFLTGRLRVDLQPALSLLSQSDF